MSLNTNKAELYIQDNSINNLIIIILEVNPLASQTTVRFIYNKVLFKFKFTRNEIAC